MKKLRILIADDDEILLDLYEMILEAEYPCQIVKVRNGTEAIDKLKELSDIDLIISDYYMPRGNGGDVYLFNKQHKNIPFFLLSGGELEDYGEFSDFKTINKYNSFFNKPFDDSDLSDAIAPIYQDEVVEPERLVKVKLSRYIEFTKNAADVYLKLSENKFTKVAKATPDNFPDIELLQHYLNKGAEYVYLEKSAYRLFMQDIFNLFNQQLIGEEKAEAILEISGLHLHISLEGLKEIGISDLQIEKTNAIIEETINSLLDDPNVKERFQKLCANEGFAIGHSLLIIYIAGRIAHDIHLNYEATMKKICVAAFYHDFSIFDLDALEEQLKIEDIHDEKIKMQILEHPTHSVNFLPTDLDFIEDTRKIILEHHEQPNGDGYPKKLTAKQIAPLSCLFILSQEITFCLIRNNFSRERLSDYLINKENYFNDGNFAKFYNAARAVFVLNT